MRQHSSVRYAESHLSAHDRFITHISTNVAHQLVSSDLQLPSPLIPADFVHLNALVAEPSPAGLAGWRQQNRVCDFLNLFAERAEMVLLGAGVFIGVFEGVLEGWEVDAGC